MSRYLNFCPNVFGHVGKRLDKKASVNFKIYEVTIWETNNYNTTLLNISRSKGNQTMKFDQLIEYKMRNNFIKKSSQNVVEKLVPDSFRNDRN